MMGGTKRDGDGAVPAGRRVELPGRGRTFVRELPGPEGAPVVLLLHGWTATAALNWATCFAPLAEHFRVVALDHRGHGRGLRDGAPFRLEDCAADVAALVGELGIRDCIAVGYSMGGPIAQLMWRRHPELVAGLVLCATSATFSGTPRERMLSGMAAGGSIIAGAVPSQLLRLGALSMCRGWRQLRGAASSWPEEIARHDWSKIIQAGREICRFDSRSWLAGTSVPATVIATNDDAVVPYRRQLALAAAIPGATLRTVDGGHTACTMSPGSFVPALVDACIEVAQRAARTDSPRRVGNAA